MEEWRDIADFPGYQVSSYGRIRSHNKVTSSRRFKRREWKDRIIKPKTGKDKCQRVELWKEGKHKTILVYRLEAVAFLGGSLDSKLTVNHKDGNRLNNHIENLEWLSVGDNIRHGFNNGLFDANKKACVLVSETETRRFTSMSEASRFLGRTHSYVFDCLKQGRVAVSKDGKSYIVKKVE